jgi:hypothetical protein
MDNHNYEIIKMNKLKVSFDKSWWTKEMKYLGKTGSGKIGAFIPQASFTSFFMLECLS